MLACLLTVIVVNEAVWIDYNPIDGCVETIDSQYHIPEISENPKSNSPRSVRFDDGWEVYRRPTQKPSKAPTSRPTKRPTTIQTNRTKYSNEKKRSVQSMHQIARQIIQHSVSEPTHRPTKPPKLKKLPSQKVGSNIPSKSTSKNRQPHHHNLSSSLKTLSLPLITDIPTTSKNEDNFIHIYVIDDAKYKEQFVDAFESQLASSEPNSLFILNSIPLIANIGRTTTKKTNIVSHSDDIDFAMYCISSFMTHIQAWRFPFKMNEISEWMILSLIELSKLRDHIFRSIHRKLKLLYPKPNKFQKDLLAQILSIYELAGISDHHQRDKRLKQKEKLL